MYLRVQLAGLYGHILRILLYARYSTEEQDASSIADQFRKCRQLLTQYNVTEPVITELHDAELSGELLQRPGIDEVAKGIQNGAWDLIIVEESSRLFRAIAPALTLVGHAVDAGIRVICINDEVDTMDDSWQDRLTEALAHHARSNRFAALRIKRKHDALWATGAAIGLLRPGYFRVATTPASLGAKARGPFFDHKDPQWEPTIIELYERIADEQPPWAVAEWLNTTGLPKCSNAFSHEWNAKVVIALIRRPDYRGIQLYRDKVVQKQHSTGKHLLVKNRDEAARLTREMPHLRIVSDALWASANAAIDARTAVRSVPKGKHPLAGIPRDSRGPLSTIFFCGICGGKMYQDGRGEGGYRCSGAKSGACWNKASADRRIVHAEIGKAIVERILESSKQLAVVAESVSRKMEVERSVGTQLAESRVRLQRAEQKLEKVAKLVERLEDDAEAFMAIEGKLRAAGAEVSKYRLECERLGAMQLKEAELEISEEAIHRGIREAASRLLDLDSGTAGKLRELVSRIEAFPYSQITSAKVVLRAKFTLNLVCLLPECLSRMLEYDETTDGELRTVILVVDLFNPSNAPKYAMQAVALQEKGLVLEKIGEELGISKRSAHLAVQYGRAMIDRGLTDPFVELAEPPTNASRWRDKGHRRKAG